MVLSTLTVLLATASVAASAPDATADPGPSTDGEEVRAPREASTIPDDATLEAAGALIGTIDVEAGDIFDPEAPGESNRLFRAANKLHIVTRDNVILKQLLFKTGDRYSRRVLDESERALRTNGYLYEATIRPVRYEDGRVDVRVETRDVWTLRMGVGMKRGGGENAFRFGIQDENLFGTGKEVAVRRSSNVDRTETLYRYRDKNLAGRHVQLLAAYSSNSDGDYSTAAVERGFYSLDARWSSGVTFFSGDRVESQYQGGEIVSKVRRDRDSIEVYGGLSHGLKGDRANRYLAGFSRSEERFEPVAGENAPADFPEDRLLSYPWIGFEQIQDHFVEITDFDRIQRTEDHNLGRELRARVGYSAPMFGGDRERWIYSGSYAQGFNPGNGQLLFLDAAVNGRYASELENFVIGGGFRYDVRNFGRHMFHAALHGDAASNLDPENQLLLGGDNGLRGYPLRYCAGDRRVLMTLEQRLYTDWHVAKLVHVGAVVFYDAGLAWYADDPASANRPLLHDVGVGLRFSSSRASVGGLLKIDIAFPLNAPEGIPSRQLLISTGATF